MFQMGIVPIEDPTLDFRRVFKDMNQDEARKLKRKFRKLWRKIMARDVAAKASKGGTQSKELIDKRADAIKAPYGAGKTVPSRAERTYRKRQAYELIWKELIAPMIVRFEHPDNPNAGQKT